MQEDLNKIQQERTAKYQAELNSANKAIAEIPNKYEELKQKNEQLGAQLKSLGGELVLSRRQSESLERTINASSEKAKQLEQELVKNEKI